MQRSQRVTLADIAARSGVSTATASMILSERPDVSFSRETVLKVREAAEALGYRGIRRHRPSHLMAEKSVAVLCPNVVNPYYATLVQSVQDAAARYDYDTMVFPTYRDAAVEARLLRTLSAASIGGIVFCAMPLCPAQAELANRETPVVVIGDRDASLNLDTVELNNYNAGVLVARYLIGLGHRSVACIATPLNKDNSARLRRLEGLRDVFRESCPEGRFLVRTCTITPEQERGDLNIEHRTGYTLARRCMAERDITAFVAVNDMVAYGVLDAILESGARVPEDYSLCGFDNIYPSHFSRVGLTTVEHHIAEKGRSALLAAANAAVMLSAISRTSEGDTRISVGKLVAGTGRNITPAHAHMECEVRGTTSEACDFMWEKAQTVVKGAAEMMGVEVKLTKVGEATTLKATPAAMEVVRKAAAAAKDVKEVKEITAPQASEDCTIFTRAVVAHGGNAAFFLYGCEHHGHHRPDFDVQDTVNLEPGLEVFAGIAKEVLGRK